MPSILTVILIPCDENKSERDFETFLNPNLRRSPTRAESEEFPNQDAAFDEGYERGEPWISNRHFDPVRFYSVSTLFKILNV